MNSIITIFDKNNYFPKYCGKYVEYETSDCGDFIIFKIPYSIFIKEKYKNVTKEHIKKYLNNEFDKSDSELSLNDIFENFVKGFKSCFTVNQNYPEFYLLKNKIDNYIILEQRETEFTLLIDSKYYTEISDELETINNLNKKYDTSKESLFPFLV